MWLIFNSFWPQAPRCGSSWAVLGVQGDELVQKSLEWVFPGWKPIRPPGMVILTHFGEWRGGDECWRGEHGLGGGSTPALPGWPPALQTPSCAPRTRGSGTSCFSVLPASFPGKKWQITASGCTSGEEVREAAGCNPACWVWSRHSQTLLMLCSRPAAAVEMCCSVGGTVPSLNSFQSEETMEGWTDGGSSGADIQTSEKLPWKMPAVLTTWESAS